MPAEKSPVPGNQEPFILYVSFIALILQSLIKLQEAEAFVRGGALKGHIHDCWASEAQSVFQSCLKDNQCALACFSIGTATTAPGF